MIQISSLKMKTNLGLQKSSGKKPTPLKYIFFARADRNVRFTNVSARRKSTRSFVLAKKQVPNKQID